MNIKWKELTVDSVTSLYMYGSLKKPTDLLDNALTENRGATVRITDVDDFMKNGPGRFATARRFSFVDDFFDGDYDEQILSAGGSSDINDLAPKVRDSDGEWKYPSNRKYRMTHAFYEPEEKDHKLRTYVYSSASYALSGAKLVVEKIVENGEVKYNRYIEDLLIVPFDDNFDFSSANYLVKISNSFSRDKIDPSDIGSTVNIEYETSDVKPISLYTVDDYKNDLITITPTGGLSKAIGYTFSLDNELWNSGVIKTLDPEGRAIIYGSEKGEYITNPDDYLPVNAHSIVDSQLEEYWEDHESLGYAIVAGAGDDTLEGGEYSDKLLGGKDYDTYRAGNGDTIIDSDGKGEVFFDTDLLSGVKTEVEGSNGTLYEDARYYYRFESPDGRGKLTVAKKDSNGGFGGEALSIEAYRKGELKMRFIPKDQKSVELTLSDATVTEGGELSFTVALTEPLKYDLTVDVGAYFKEPGHADANDLEGALSGTVTIKATETSATFTIRTLKDDDNNEGIENFTFAATGYRYAGEGRADNDLGFLLIKNAAEGTIVDEGYDDTLKVEVSSQSMEESTGVMRFTVTLKGELKENEKLTVDLATYDDTATGEYDYAHVTKSVTFTKDTLTHTIEVPIYDDSYQESDERFFLAPRAYRDYEGDKTVELANAGIGTILKSDPEGRIVIEVGSVSADEGDEGGSAKVPVSLTSSHPSQKLIYYHQMNYAIIPRRYAKAAA